MECLTDKRLAIPPGQWQEIAREEARKLKEIPVPSMRELYYRLSQIEDILGEEYNLDRLRELAQADRLIGKTIYRPGDPIKQAYEWEVTMFEVYPDTIVLYDDSDNTFCLNDIGKTVFLTREEAEAALATDC